MPVVVLKVPLPNVAQLADVAPPPSVTLKLALLPAHTATELGAAIVAGLGHAHAATVTAVLAVAVQPSPLVTVTT